MMQVIQFNGLIFLCVKISSIVKNKRMKKKNENKDEYTVRKLVDGFILKEIDSIEQCFWLDESH